MHGARSDGSLRSHGIPERRQLVLQKQQLVGLLDPLSFMVLSFMGFWS